EPGYSNCPLRLDSVKRAFEQHRFKIENKRAKLVAPLIETGRDDRAFQIFRLHDGTNLRTPRWRFRDTRHVHIYELAVLRIQGFASNCGKRRLTGRSR